MRGRTIRTGLLAVAVALAGVTLPERAQALYCYVDSSGGTTRFKCGEGEQTVSGYADPSDGTRSVSFISFTVRGADGTQSTIKVDGPFSMAEVQRIASGGAAAMRELINGGRYRKFPASATVPASSQLSVYLASTNAPAPPKLSSCKTAPMQRYTNFDDLNAYMSSNGITSMDDLAGCLPDDCRRNYTFAYKSGSAAAECVDEQHPRVIMTCNGGDTMIGLPGNKAKPGCNSMEVVDYNKTKAKFSGRSIAFPDPYLKPPQPARPTADWDPKDKMVHPPGASCVSCHGQDWRPNWEGYPLWPGIYGGADDRLLPGSKEAKDYAAFVKGNSKSARYSFLEPPPGSPYKYPGTTYTSNDVYPYSAVKADQYPGVRPNLRLSVELQRRDTERMIRKFSETSDWQANKYRALNELTGCAPMPSPSKKAVYDQIMADVRKNLKKEDDDKYRMETGNDPDLNDYALDCCPKPDPVMGIDKKKHDRCRASGKPECSADPSQWNCCPESAESCGMGLGGCLGDMAGLDCAKADADCRKAGDPDCDQRRSKCEASLRDIKDECMKSDTQCRAIAGRCTGRRLCLGGLARIRNNYDYDGSARPIAAVLYIAKVEFGMSDADIQELVPTMQQHYQSLGVDNSGRLLVQVQTELLRRIVAGLSDSPKKKALAALIKKDPDCLSGPIIHGQEATPATLYGQAECMSLRRDMVDDGGGSFGLTFANPAYSDPVCKSLLAATKLSEPPPCILPASDPVSPGNVAAIRSVSGAVGVANSALAHDCIDCHARNNVYGNPVLVDLNDPDTLKKALLSPGGCGLQSQILSRISTSGSKRMPPAGFDGDDGPARKSEIQGYVKGLSCTQ